MNFLIFLLILVNSKKGSDLVQKVPKKDLDPILNPLWKKDLRPDHFPKKDLDPDLKIQDLKILNLWREGEEE